MYSNKIIRTIVVDLENRLLIFYSLFWDFVYLFEGERAQQGEGKEREKRTPC